MFASLKNKIKEETGTDVTVQRKTTFLSEQRDNELSALKLSHTELERQLEVLAKSLDNSKDERTRLEASNVLLEESLRLAQEQKDMITDEHDKIQNLQHKENEKLKNLLLFKDQEAVDRVTALRAAQLELDRCKEECIRLQGLESQLEDLKDDLERVRHSSQLEKAQMSNSLASVQEENRHLKMRLEIVEQSRTGFSDQTRDDQVQSLIHERKLLEQRLEEAHLHLIDIKSSWSGQNLSLETQVARLSRQVAEETADKRKALKLRDQYLERIKELEKSVELAKKEVSEKDNKIRLLNEELEEMNASLNKLQRKLDERNGENKKEIETLSDEKDTLQDRFDASETLLRDQLQVVVAANEYLQREMVRYEERTSAVTASLEKEKSERVRILLKNAELTQNEESLKKDLKQERDELEELLEQVKTMQRSVEIAEKNEKDLIMEIEGLNLKIHEKETEEREFLKLSEELNEKNKLIKVLNQRLVDMKKTLQEEITGKRSQIQSEDLNSTQNHKLEPTVTSSNGVVTMDEINFKYLKHVIMRFVTCRDVEARHMLRAVGTLLQLSSEEERLLDEMYKWRSSWFFGGSKPDIGQLSS